MPEPKGTEAGNTPPPPSPPPSPPSYEDAIASTGLDQGPSGLTSLAKQTTTRADDIPDFKPIVIPQTTARLMNTFLSPFARAYPPEMAPLMTDTAFLQFIDDLNEAFMASPALQALGLAGNIMSFDPTGTVQMAGIGIQIGTGLASAGTSYARTKVYVKNINASTFAPLGLRARILSTKKMMQHVGISDGQGLKLPALPEFDEDWDPKAPELDPRRRRLAALGDAVADLDWIVAPMRMPDNFLRKMGAWQAGFQETQQRRRQHRRLHKLHKRESRVAAFSNETEGGSATKLDAKRQKAARRLESQGNTARAQRKYEKKMAKIDRKEARGWFKNKIGIGKEAKAKRKASRQRNKYQRKERRIMQRVRWIVIEKYDWEAAGVGAEDEEDDDDMDVGMEEVEVEVDVSKQSGAGDGEESSDDTTSSDSDESDWHEDDQGDRKYANVDSKNAAGPTSSAGESWSRDVKSE